MYSVLHAWYMLVPCTAFHHTYHDASHYLCNFFFSCLSPALHSGLHKDRSDVCFVPKCVSCAWYDTMVGRVGTNE